MCNKFFLCFICFTVFACSNSQEGSDNPKETESTNFQLDWMEGDWIDSTTMGFKKVSYGERWSKKESNIYKGVKYSVTNGIEGEDPVLASLIKTDGLFYLTYTVEETQHTFVQDSIHENFLRLTHLQDKFPTTLIYRLQNDTLLITREGLAGGIPRSVTFKALKISSIENSN